MMHEAMAVRNGQQATLPLPRGASGERAASSWLVCRAGTMLCALPVEQVVEIMRALPLEPFTGAPRYVRGLSIIRGAAVPVVDIGLLLGGAATTAARLVTIKTANRTVALAMTAVLGISAIAPDTFGQLPPLLKDAAADTVSAIGALDAELLVFLRGSRIVPDEVFACLDAEGTPQ